MYVIVPTTIPAIEMDRALRPSANASFMSPLLAAEDDRAGRNKNIVFKKTLEDTHPACISTDTPRGALLCIHVMDSLDSCNAYLSLDSQPT